MKIQIEKSWQHNKEIIETYKQKVSIHVLKMLMLSLEKC